MAVEVATAPALKFGKPKVLFRPPAEVAVHPADEVGGHEMYLMCDDLGAEMSVLASKGVRCSDVEEARWGSVTKIQLPGGGTIGLYQPKHPSALGLRP